ncbi:hypothetical protein PIB30_019598 [Stylosanthes scabra]|uniref:Uncharacterized protein n=1 Tax=Stylosanthes scabra TaxID=79078 RepID=A0ABU6Z8M3_9FABA|nr:hypothetical protein [Stylosanthes scabra]
MSMSVAAVAPMCSVVAPSLSNHVPAAVNALEVRRIRSLLLALAPGRCGCVVEFAAVIAGAYDRLRSGLDDWSSGKYEQWLSGASSGSVGLGYDNQPDSDSTFNVLLLLLPGRGARVMAQGSSIQYDLSSNSVTDKIEEQLVFLCDVDEEYILKIGMTFLTCEEVNDFYKEYAKALSNVSAADENSRLL